MDFVNIQQIASFFLSETVKVGLFRQKIITTVKVMQGHW